MPALSPDQITTLFAEAATISPTITGQPTSDDITTIEKILMPLLFSIDYDEVATPGAIQHNLIGLVQDPTIYSARWHAPFDRPVRVATYDTTIPDDATAVVRNRREAAHAAILADYNTYAATETAVAKFIRERVDEVYYKDLESPTSYYNDVTATDLLIHLRANCQGMESEDLLKLQTAMHGYYDTCIGIPEYINELEEARKILARGNLPMSDAQVLAIASASVHASQHFVRVTEDWGLRLPANKTWAEWKIAYRAAHIARARLLKSQGASTFGTANAATAIDGTSTGGYTKLESYLDNIALAATNDSKTLAQLIAANATLAADVNTLTQKLNNILASGTPTTTTPTNTPRTPLTPDRARALLKKRLLQYDRTGYCWSHGYLVHKTHTSETCKHKKANHKNNATKTNTMNGMTYNEGWDVGWETVNQVP